jgi:excisionase family DNA binding protein
MIRERGAGVVTDERPELITIREAAKILGVHPSTLRNWDRAGRLKAVRVGSRRDRRFKRAEVLAAAQVQGRDDLVTAKDLKQAARVVLQDSIRGASIAEIAKALGTTPAGLNELVARCEAAMDGLRPMRQIQKLVEDSFGGWFDQLETPMLQALPTLGESFKQLTAPALWAFPSFHDVVEPVLREQELLGERLTKYLSSAFGGEALSSGVYARLAATQAELFSTQAITSLMACVQSSSMAQVASLIPEQIRANIEAYQDLSRAVLWDLDALGVAGDKRLPFAELKLAGGLLQSATTLVADLSAEAGDARAASVKKPNLFRHFHNDARQLPAPEQLSDGQLEAQLKATASFRAGNAGLAVVQALDQVNRALQLRGQDPIFQPSVETGAIAARLCLSCAGDKAEFAEVCDGLYKLIFEASGDGRRLRPLAEPHEYEAVEHILILRNDYRHDLAQGASPRGSRRRLGKVGEVLQRLAGKRLPSSPADWQRVFLALMGGVGALLRGVADRLEDGE